MYMGAVISKCGLYRYSLYRTWDNTKPHITFIGVNPSTACANLDDQTIRRCIWFAQKFGAGGLIMLNLFAYRATKFSDLKTAYDPIGDNNKSVLQHAAEDGGQVIACWGGLGIYRNRDRLVSSWFTELWCFGKNGNGTPKHPLYLRSSTELCKYK